MMKYNRKTKSNDSIIMSKFHNVKGVSASRGDAPYGDVLSWRRQLDIRQSECFGDTALDRKTSRISKMLSLHKMMNTIIRSKLVLCLLILAVLLPLPIQAAHFVCGEVENAADGTDPGWRNVKAYYENDSDNHASCQISPENNRYCCDAESIPGHSWQPGDIIFAEVIDDLDGYHSSYVSAQTTDGGFDVLPEMTLILDPSSPNVRPPPAITPVTPAAGGAGGGGGGGGLPRRPIAAGNGTEITYPENISYSNYTRYSKVFQNPIFYKVKEEGNSLRQIIIWVNKGIEDVFIRSVYSSTLPPEMEIPRGAALYQFVMIEKRNIADEDIDKTDFTFRISKDWLKKRRVLPEKIVIASYDPSSPTGLKEQDHSTTEDPDYVYYSLQGNTMPHFVIYGITEPLLPDLAKSMGIPVPVIWMILAIAVTLIMTIVLIIVFRTKRKRK